MNVRVIIADDHGIVRHGIRAVLERKAAGVTVVGEASNGRELLKSAHLYKPDIFIIDVAMPHLNGLEACRRLTRLYPQSRVIILTMYDTRSSVEKALGCGASGYILKENAADEVVQAVNDVSRGAFYFSPKIAHFVTPSGSLRHSRCAVSNAPKLTRKEREILQCVGEGSSTKEIALALKISPNTVHVHRTNLMRKLNLHTQADLIRFALKEGIAAL